MSRLSPLIGTQPSPRVLAQTQTPEQVYQIALQRGQAMRDLGITIDFAPVVDVTDEPDDEVIGDRSFGSDPATVTDYAGAYARGLRDAGLLPVLKHFPGHGHGSGDSHTGGVTTPPIADLQNNDLVPYRTLTTQAPVARHGRAHAGARPDRQRPGEPEPGRLRAAARRATTAVRRSTARCSPTTCRRCRRSPTASGSPRPRCADCRPAPTPRCG